jgi:NADPH:quinone reductase-like Zn-dependent oxidoreductase
MRAARVHKPGPANVIVVENINLPERSEQEVLVRVSAAGVGPWDALVRTGNSGPNVRLAKQHGVQSDYLIVDANTAQTDTACATARKTRIDDTPG